MAAHVVLIADDDLMTLTVLQSMLEIAGYTVFTAENGREALEAALTVQPDIILSDVMMPKIDGFELCRRLREKPETSRVPLLFMTSLSDEIFMMNGLQQGAVGYILKPFDNEDVLAQVSRTLQRTTHTTPKRESGEHLSFQELLQVCARDRITGVIRLAYAGRKGRIELRSGEVSGVDIREILQETTLEEMCLWGWEDGIFSIEDTEDDDSPDSDAIPAQPQKRPGTQRQTSTRKEVNSMATKTEQLKQILEEVKAELTDADGIAIVAGDGTTFASTVVGADATRIGAMIATIVGLSRRACQTLKRGEPAETLLKGADGFVAIYPAGKKATLGVTTKADANLGMLNLVCSDAAEKIREVLA